MQNNCPKLELFGTVVMSTKGVDGMANSVDLDQTAHDLSLHCLLRPMCLNV